MAFCEILEPHEPGPFVFGADDPEHLRGKRRARVDAAHHRGALQPWNLHLGALRARNRQRQRLLGRCVGERAREHHEAGVLAEQGEHLCLAETQQRRQLLGDGERLLDQIGIDR